MSGTCGVVGMDSALSTWTVRVRYTCQHRLTLKPWASLLNGITNHSQKPEAYE